MPSDADLKNLSRLRAQGAAVPSVIPKIPQLPADVVKRFPSVNKWHQDMEKWRQETMVALGWTLPSGG